MVVEGPLPQPAHPAPRQPAQHTSPLRWKLMLGERCPVAEAHLARIGGELNRHWRVLYRSRSHGRWAYTYVHPFVVLGRPERMFPEETATMTTRCAAKRVAARLAVL
jgi:hypothetical protein